MLRGQERLQVHGAKLHLVADRLTKPRTAGPFPINRLSLRQFAEQRLARHLCLRQSFSEAKESSAVQFGNKNTSMLSKIHSL
jgi:hypothetical protein